jgi:hypothetical protein
MTTFPLMECCSMLGIDPKTLRQWLQQANMPLQAHPTDARLKCLTTAQVWQLATAHGRSIQPSTTTSPLGAELAQEVALSKGDPPNALVACEESALIERLTSLELSIHTIQQQMTQLALALLQERERSYEQRLQTLEALLQQTGQQEVFTQPPPIPSRETPSQEASQQGRCLHPAELRARSRLIPLIEYGTSGTYVAVCPQEGVLSLTVDSPEWFEWLATLSSFRFVGQQGRFSAYREHKHRCPTRSWRAYRSIHSRNYKHSLGVTDQLSIHRLEQVAAILQSHLASYS